MQIAPLTGIEAQVAGWAAVVGGLLLTFLGHRTIRLSVRVYGFVMGALAVPYFAWRVGTPHIDQLWMMGLMAVCGGIVGCWLSRPGYYAVIFLTAAATAPALWEYFAIRMPSWAPAWGGWAAPLALGVGLGSLAIFLERPLVIQGTALSGPLLVSAGARLLEAWPAGWDSWERQILLGAASLGALMQFLQKPRVDAKAESAD